jgi:hypothetical protein
MFARWIGIALTAAGITAMAGVLGPLANYTYAIVWWGILILIDERNFRHRGLSLWRGSLSNGPFWRASGARFLLVTLPLSTVFWLFFEMLNLASPQWRYRGGLSSVGAQVLFGFVSFATVIPIVIEVYWLIAGEFRLPSALEYALRSYSKAFAVVGAALALLPLVNHRFWLNQGMWLAPALLFLPVAPTPLAPAMHHAENPGKLALRITAAGLVAGFLWEALNWFSRTHWEYLILPSWPHIFQMPWLGYIGFIPFAFTVLVVYALASRIPANVCAGLWLYGIAFAGLYILTVLYDRRGLWLGYDFPSTGAR